jgi:hypothetical protein
MDKQKYKTNKDSKQIKLNHIYTSFFELISIQRISLVDYFQFFMIKFDRCNPKKNFVLDYKKNP